MEATQKTEPSRAITINGLIIRLLVVGLVVFATRYVTAQLLTSFSEDRKVDSRANVISEIEPVDLGQVKAKSEQKIEFKITNSGDHKIKILGHDQSCTCTTANVLPNSIEPRSTQLIDLNIHIPEEPGNFSGTFKIFTDVAAQRAVVLRFSATVQR